MKSGRFTPGQRRADSATACKGSGRGPVPLLSLCIEGVPSSEREWLMQEGHLEHLAGLLAMHPLTSGAILLPLPVRRG